MPLQIELREGRAAPVVICDQCGDKIERAGEGNYHWLSGAPDERRPLYFLHELCVLHFQRDHQPGPGQRWTPVELMLLPIFLGTSLEVDWEHAWDVARQLRDLPE
jgi:hypothetical protein